MLGLELGEGESVLESACDLEVGGEKSVSQCQSSDSLKETA